MGMGFIRMSSPNILQRRSMSLYEPTPKIKKQKKIGFLKKAYTFGVLTDDAYLKASLTFVFHATTYHLLKIMHV